MKGELRALLQALQQGKGADVVGPLITPETAGTPDTYYRLLPLHWALSYGASADVVKLLLEAHPSAVREQRKDKAWTVLHYCERASPAVVKLLLARCPENTSCKDTGGMLPLHWAAEGSDAAEVVRLIAEAFPEGKQIQDARGLYPYDLALQNSALQGNTELLSSLAVEALADEAGGAVAVGDVPPVLPSAEDVALLFPGQGSQYVGMLAEVAQLPAVQSMLKEAQQILGYDILDICLNGPEEKLQDTLYCQPAMYIAGLAALEKLRASHPAAAERPRCVAGLSLGEYTALTAAGVFSFRDGLSLVKVRAAAMQEAAELRQQAMISCAGLEETKVIAFCEQAVKEIGTDEVCQISNFLFPKGYSIGGTTRAVQRCFELCQGGGAMQVKMLKTGGGFHTPLMLPAREKLARKLEELLPRLSSPKCQVYMNVTSEVIGPSTEASEIVDLLSRQLTSPVQWTASLRSMVQDCPAKIYEVGPQKQLRAMLKRINNTAFQKAHGIEV